MLTLLGGGALTVLVGCAPSDDDTGGASVSTTTSGRSSTTEASSSDGQAGETCTTIPEETAGPFPGDGSNGPNVLDDQAIVRRDITASYGGSDAVAEGVPLTITLDIVDAVSCQAMSGAAVYVWHCDREGGYSLYSSGLEEVNYLRGVQETDAAGRATFDSIFPGAYSGRWPHIHFEVYESLAAATGGREPIATSQIALPEAECDAAYATAGYEQSVVNMRRTSLARDMVFRDDSGAQQLGTMTGSASSGFTVQLDVPVNA